MHPYAFNDIVYAKLVALCVDICKRNGKKKLLWLGDKEKTLAYQPKADEMVLTVHRWFKNKACPGEWMYSNMGELARSVTNALNPVSAPAPKKIYRVQCGAFSNKSNAEKLRDSLKAKGFDAVILE